jgi:hypothetical protein
MVEVEPFCSEETGGVISLPRLVLFNAIRVWICAEGIMASDAAPSNSYGSAANDDGVYVGIDTPR